MYFSCHIGLYELKVHPEASYRSWKLLFIQSIQGMMHSLLATWMTASKETEKLYERIMFLLPGNFLKRIGWELWDLLFFKKNAIQPQIADQPQAHTWMYNFSWISSVQRLASKSLSRVVAWTDCGKAELPAWRQVVFEINNAFHNPMWHHVLWSFERCNLLPSLHASQAFLINSRTVGPVWSWGSRRNGGGQGHMGEEDKPERFLPAFSVLILALAIAVQLFASKMRKQNKTKQLIENLST